MTLNGTSRTLLYTLLLCYIFVLLCYILYSKYCDLGRGVRLLMTHKGTSRTVNPLFYFVGDALELYSVQRKCYFLNC